MKTLRIRLTSEQHQKLEQVLKRLKHKNVQDYFVSMLNEAWLKI